MKSLTAHRCCENKPLKFWTVFIHEQELETVNLLAWFPTSIIGASNPNNNACLHHVINADVESINQFKKLFKSIYTDV